MDEYQSSRSCACCRCRGRGVVGPVVLITIGILALLDSLDVPHADFARTWPLILIAIGVVLIIQRSASTAGHIPPGSPGAPEGGGQ